MMMRALSSIYGVEFWGHAADTNLREIKVIQKDAFRVANFQGKTWQPYIILFKRHKNYAC